MELYLRAQRATLKRSFFDAAYGSAKMLAWLVHEQGIEPHVPVFDKSERKDGTFARDNFQYDHEGDVYTCPAGTKLRKYCRPFAAPRIGVTKANTMLYRASKFDCAACALKPRCCPNTPARKVPRSSHEGVPCAEPPLDEHSAAGQGSPVVLLDQVREPPQCTSVQTGKRARYSV